MTSMHGRIAETLCGNPAIAPAPDRVDADMTPSAGRPRPDPSELGWTMLPRNGRRPLGFHGRLLFEANTRGAGLPSWSDIAIHETQSGQFVAALRHGLQGRAQPIACHATVCDDAAEVHAFFRTHDCLADLPIEALAAGLPAVIAPAVLIAATRSQAGRQRAAWQALLDSVLGRDPAADVEPDLAPEPVADLVPEPVADRAPKPVADLVREPPADVACLADDPAPKITVTHQHAQERTRA